MSSTSTLYAKYDNHQTQILDCPGLANLIEQDKKTEIKEYLKTKLTPYKGISNVVLGCTHYPLIKTEIANVLGNVNFFEGSKGVTKQLKKVINQIGLKETSSEIIFFDSSKDSEKEKRFWNLLN